MQTHHERMLAAIKGEPIIAGAYSTVLHSILFAILIMGARDIRLLGCDHSKKGNLTYFSKAQEVESDTKNKLRVVYRRESWYMPHMTKRQQYGTNLFIEVCKKHGIQITRYKDYEEWTGRNKKEQFVQPIFRPGARR